MNDAPVVCIQVTGNMFGKDYSQQIAFPWLRQMNTGGWWIFLCKHFPVPYFLFPPNHLTGVQNSINAPKPRLCPLQSWLHRINSGISLNHPGLNTLLRTQERQQQVEGMCIPAPDWPVGQKWAGWGHAQLKNVVVTFFTDSSLSWENIFGFASSKKKVCEFFLLATRTPVQRWWETLLEEGPPKPLPELWCPSACWRGWQWEVGEKPCLSSVPSACDLIWRDLQSCI